MYTKIKVSFKCLEMKFMLTGLSGVSAIISDLR